MMGGVLMCSIRYKYIIYKKGGERKIVVRSSAHLFPSVNVLSVFSESLSE